MDPVYSIDAGRRFVSLYWDEFPSLAQLREVVENAVADPEFRAGMNFLWDRRPGSPNTATVEMLTDLEPVDAASLRQEANSRDFAQARDPYQSAESVFLGIP